MFPSGTETRLIPSDNTNYTETVDYDYTQYEENLFWFNDIARKTFFGVEQRKVDELCFNREAEAAGVSADTNREAEAAGASADTDSPPPAKRSRKAGGSRFLFLQIEWVSLLLGFSERTRESTNSQGSISPRIDPVHGSGNSPCQDPKLEGHIYDPTSRAHPNVIQPE